MTYKNHFIAFLVLFSLNGWAIEQIADPTMPANYKAAMIVSTPEQALLSEHYEWVLNSTIISPHLKLAIINGRQLKLGENINGATLKRIEHQKVELSYQDQTITLLLHHSFISQIKSSSKP
ncbi:MAG: hypothetical protein PSN44_04470 [Gammaproteobacteria bacterium]|nr:hypothetical protein [Gammaproteobacteria bacterium]